MDEEELQRLRASSMHYCNRLINEIRKDQDDIDSFFGGELYKTYRAVNDKVLNKTRDVYRKIRNL